MDQNPYAAPQVDLETAPPIATAVLYPVWGCASAPT